MSTSGVAQETLAIVARGTYVAPSGATVDIGAQIDAAVNGTVLYTPDDLEALVLAPSLTSSSDPPRVEVTGETTAEAARRLVSIERQPHVVVLNFASAKNPGGGFLGGAKAQEEDLCRCSALYTAQLTQPAYYEVNRATSSMLYTDHIIYSPSVPFFRDDRLRLLDEPFTVSVITAPAPNAGQAEHKGRGESRQVREVLEARAGKVLAVAAANGHRTLVLGAWGCGVFRNEPRDVAEVFARWIEHPRFRGAFERIVFAVFDRGKGQPNLRAFEERFAR